MDPQNPKHTSPLDGQLHRIAVAQQRRVMQEPFSEQLRAVLLNCASTLESTATRFDEDNQPRTAAYLRERAAEAHAAHTGPEALAAFYRRRDEADRLAAGALNRIAESPAYGRAA